ncbi:mitochondrial import inner membrane translocase subunit tim16-A-like [Hibiscus syriacus]|uniref:Mitochondrial import inner membrane translocase subunit tim16-A-like n=1 Tax=Hibiscus syriacus TaxID=106335 RepID=A0A6A2ZCG5_HIBSY|nr:mitochondrial import inner membrane translocase subunit tim16-A-like [Hibiscus syriacus]
MRAKRGYDDSVDEEPELKRKRVMDLPSSPPEGPLVPYNDDDGDERRTLNIIGGGKEADKRVESEEEEEDDDDPYGQGSILQRPNRQVEVRRDCPYLDTVNRQYFQGRGENSHAYTHSLEAGHHVYINLRTEKVCCLPDGFSREQLDKNKQWSRALDGSDYLPGMVGLNNIQKTDFVIVTIQSLMRVTPLRNFFLIPENYQHSRSQLVHRFGELTRKIWHARNFEGQVSPHEFLQAVMKASKKWFRIGMQSEPVEYMSWLLNTLHADLRTSMKSSSIIHKCFQGELEVVKEIQSKAISKKKESDEEQNGTLKIMDGTIENNNNVSTETHRMPFLMLGLDLPEPPLFKDLMEKNIIPQVPLFNILKKLDGETVTTTVRPPARMRYRVTKLAQYLILHMRRFTKNNFFREKNPTLVNFPVKNLELKDYIPLPAPTKDNEKLRTKYDLIANIVHDGKPDEGFYRVFVQRKYEMQDLNVSETLPQMVALSEAYMQIFEQQQ